MRLPKTKPDTTLDASDKDCPGYRNMNTAWLDGSQVYGAAANETAALWTKSGPAGRMHVSLDERGRELLPHSADPANELGRGYPMSSVANLLSGNIGAKATNARNWGHWVDGTFGGLIPRWEVLFNVTVLRLISFNYDYLWSLDHRAVSPVEVC